MPANKENLDVVLSRGIAYLASGTALLAVLVIVGLFIYAPVIVLSIFPAFMMAYGYGIISGANEMYAISD